MSSSLLLCAGRFRRRSGEEKWVERWAAELELGVCFFAKLKEKRGVEANCCEDWL